MLAKCKLNSIETLISQALIDFEISHEEFKIIVNEKKGMKKWNDESNDESNRWTEWWIKWRICVKIVKMHKIKKDDIFLTSIKWLSFLEKHWKKWCRSNCR